MDKNFTAADARLLTESTKLPVYIGEIIDGIKHNASLGQTTYITRKYGFGDGTCYGDESLWPALNKEIVEQLRSRGFKAAVKSKTSQFVDLWLEISW